MLKKIILVSLLNFIIFFSVGIALYDKRPITDEKIKFFIIGLENEQLLDKYLKLKNHEYLIIKIIAPTSSKEICYKILSNKLERHTNCSKDVEIILDEHAVGSLINAPYNPKNVLFSEFLMGHIKISGLKLSEILMGGIKSSEF